MKKEQSFLDWAYDTSYVNRRNTKIAITFAVFCLLLATAGIGSVMALLPLQKIEPVVITVDKGTGIVNVVSDLDDSEFEKTDVVVFSEAGKYLLLREGYFHATYVEDYKATVLMSTGKAEKQYIENYAPDAPNSLMKKHKDNIQVNITWNSFNFASKDVLNIRFAKDTVDLREDTTKRTFHIATLRFKHIEDAEMSLKMRILNPHAFVVSDYQVNMEGIQ